MPRKVNFNPGPAALPPTVLARAQQAILDYNGLGTGIMEISHRSAPFMELLEATQARMRRLLSIPDNYHILFCQGGARTQFAMVPMNFLQNTATAAYVNTGTWSKAAIVEAERFGKVNLLASSEESRFDHIPSWQEGALQGSESYIHITSNNTIYGTQWQTWPATKGVPLIVDMSSDIASRHVDISQFAMVYAGAQKNIGPAGVTVVLLQDEFAKTAQFEHLPFMLRYDTYVQNNSLYNTPPVWNIFMVSLVMEWLEEQGGLDSVARTNQKKADLLYQFIDNNAELCRGTARKDSRSQMNICFRLPNEDLEKKLVADADKAGFLGVKGHRRAGGIRVSCYNAVPLEGVERFIAYLETFLQTHCRS